MALHLFTPRLGSAARPLAPMTTTPTTSRSSSSRQSIRRGGAARRECGSTLRNRKRHQSSTQTS
eukprot:5023061-Pyramimonas_sp.AAC.1